MDPKIDKKFILASKLQAVKLKLLEITFDKSTGLEIKIGISRDLIAHNTGKFYICAQSLSPPTLHSK